MDFSGKVEGNWMVQSGWEVLSQSGVRGAKLFLMPLLSGLAPVLTLADFHSSCISTSCSMMSLLPFSHATNKLLRVAIPFIRKKLTAPCPDCSDRHEGPWKPSPMWNTAMGTGRGNGWPCHTNKTHNSLWNWLQTLTLSVFFHLRPHRWLLKDFCQFQHEKEKKKD